MDFQNRIPVTRLLSMIMILIFMKRVIGNTIECFLNIQAKEISLL